MNECSLEIIQSVLEARDDCSREKRRALLANIEEVFWVIDESRREDDQGASEPDKTNGTGEVRNQTEEGNHESVQVLRGTFSRNKVEEVNVEQMEEGDGCIELKGGTTVPCASAAFGMRAVKLRGNCSCIHAVPFVADASLINADEVKGNIAVVERGICTMVAKARFAQQAGAVAVVIINSDDSLMHPGDDGTAGDIFIPVVSVALCSAPSVANQVRVAGMTLGVPPPRMLHVIC